MDVYPIKAFTDNYIWAIIDKNTGYFDCVDPGEATPVLAFAHANSLQLRTILLTHHHNDHIGGVAQLTQSYPNALVYGPNDPRLPNNTIPVHKDELIKVGTHSFKILFNPGHTSSHISYFEPITEWLFCGDTLFSAGCGRVFDGTLQELHQSLLLFKSLPLHTKIFCSHEYTQQNLRFAQTVEPNNQDINTYKTKLEQANNPCTLPSILEDELKMNPFLRTDKKTVIDYALKHKALSSDSLEVFRVIREQKNTFQ